MPNINALHFEGYVIVFGEINLDIYVEIQSENNYPSGAVIPSIVNLKTGGNTWNIARMLALLGRKTTFACTSAKDDLPSGVLRNEVIPPELELCYIPKLGTLAPRFAAIENGTETILRTVYIPQQQQPTNEQLDFVSKIIRKEYMLGAKAAVLASSIEPQLLTHIIHECKSLNIYTIGTVSSAPSVRQYYPHLQSLSMLVLNSSEARTLLTHLTYEDNDDFARALAEYSHEVVLTCGAAGAIACSYGGEIIRCKALDLSSAFVNDLGAGDAFAAFLIDGYLRQIGKIDHNTLAWATAGAAMVCQISEHMLSNIDMTTIDDIFGLVQQVNNEGNLS